LLVVKTINSKKKTHLRYDEWVQKALETLKGNEIYRKILK